MVKFIKIIILLTACFFLGLMCVDRYKEYRKAYEKEYSDMSSSPGKDVEVTIPKGASARKIARILRVNGLIKYESAFVDRLQDSQYRGNLNSGTFTLNTGMNTLQMMEIMAVKQEEESEVETIQLVVPEGFTVDQIAARCEKNGICKASEFRNAVKSVSRSDYEFLTDVTFSADVKYKLEGFLFPATYNVPVTMKPAELVDYMCKTFEGYYTDELKSKAAERGLSTYEVVTMASLIERECKLEVERPKIARVFYNRIDQQMPLELVPTILYVSTDGLYDNVNITDSDRSKKNDYNTFIKTGLPCGPICNPGIACIKAVLNPEDGTYLYYKLDASETHVFSDTPFDSDEEGEGDNADDSDV